MARFVTEECKFVCCTLRGGPHQTVSLVFIEKSFGKWIQCADIVCDTRYIMTATAAAPASQTSSVDSKRRGEREIYGCDVGECRVCYTECSADFVFVHLPPWRRCSAVRPPLSLHVSAHSSRSSHIHSTRRALAMVDTPLSTAHARMAVHRDD